MFKGKRNICYVLHITHSQLSLSCVHYPQIQPTTYDFLTTVKKIPPPKEGMKPEKIEQIKQQKIKEIEEKYLEYTKEFREEENKVEENQPNENKAEEEKQES